MLTKLFLRFTGFLFALYGAYLYMDPQFLIDLLALGDSTAARVEIRAMYGGLQLAVGAFLILSTFRDPPFIETGLIVLIACFAGLASARAAGMIVDGVDGYNLGATIYESISLLIAILLLKKGQPAKDTS
ncbi:MAG: DUF4345 family protein [Pseudomonadota bacterium]